METLEHYEKGEDDKARGGIIALLGIIAMDLRRIADAAEQRQGESKVA